MKKFKVCMSYVIESAELQYVLPVKCSQVSGEKLNIILMRVMPLVVSILRATEHVRHLVRSSV
jgi:hypothetical protein